MATMKLALEQGGPKRLELSWGMSWKNLRVLFDGQQVGADPGGEKAFKQGFQFRLPDGSDLSIQLVQVALTPEVRVLRDGQPLPGSASDPAQQVQSAAHLLFFLAALNAVLGVVALAFDIEFLQQQLGMGVGSIAFGAILATLGFFTYRRSRVAPLLGIVLYIADFLFILYEGKGSGRPPPIGGMFVRFFIVMTLWKAMKAAGELSEQAERQQSGLSPHP